MAKTLRQAIREGIVKIGDKFEYYPGEKEKTIPGRKTGMADCQKFKTEKFKSWIFVGIDERNAVLVSNKATETKLVLKGKVVAKNGSKIIKDIARSYGDFPKVRAIAIDEAFIEKYDLKLDCEFWTSDKCCVGKVSGMHDAFYLTVITRNSEGYSVTKKLLFDEVGNRFSGSVPSCSYGIRIAIFVPLSAGISENRDILL